MLTGFDNAAANLACAAEKSLQFFTVADAYGALKSRQVFRQAAQHFQYRIAVGDKDVAPHHRIRCGNAREVSETGRRVFYNLRLDVIFEVGRGTHDRVGNQVRQMGCDRQNLIVMRGFQVIDLTTCLLPQRCNLVDCGLIGAWRWRDQKPTSLEQCFEPGLRSGIFGACDRVTWDKMDPFRAGAALPRSPRIP